MRSRGGGVLSASALVALGTSVLLAALIGLGLSELASDPRGGATGTAHAETAAVVVPGISAHRQLPHAQTHSPSATPRAGIPVLTPTTTSGGATSDATTAPATSKTSTRTTTVRSTSAPTSTSTATAKPKPTAPTPSPSPTRAHGKGKANGSGNGNGPGTGHKKP